MMQNDSLLARAKKLISSSKSVFGVAVFSVLAILCVILFFVVNHWILKALFLLIAIGAGIYIWILIQSLRITPRHANNPPSSDSAHETPSDEAESETSGQTEAAIAESMPLGGLEEQQVYVSEKGDKYHLERECSGLRMADAVEAMPENKAISIGRQPCRICWPKEPEAS